MAASLGLSAGGLLRAATPSIRTVSKSLRVGAHYSRVDKRFESRTALRIAAAYTPACASFSQQQPRLVATIAAAHPVPKAKAPVFDAATTCFLSVCTMMVLFMNLPGLCLFYGGMLESKNMLSIFTTLVAGACILTLLWFACGYSLVFSTSSSGFVGGLDKAFLSGLTPAGPLMPSGVPESLFAVFHSTYASITPCLIVGATAGRMRLFPSVAMMAAWMLAVYCPFARMVWGGGYLEQIGLIDFAGGVVIHVTAGAAALMAAQVLGPRARFTSTGGPPKPHSIAAIMAGTGLIWMSWLAFNGASTPQGVSPELAWVLVNSMCAASAGGAAWLLADSSARRVGAAAASAAASLSAAAAGPASIVTTWLPLKLRSASTGATGKSRTAFGRTTAAPPDVGLDAPTGMGACMGVVAGLVCITPAALFVSPFGAVAMGVAGALCCRAACEWLRHTAVARNSDDACEVFGLHGIGGLVGNGLTAVFAATAFGGTQAVASVPKQLLMHVSVGFFAAAYSAAATWLILKALQKIIPGGLRVEPAVEVVGLDFGIGGERAYNIL